jgi:hypothetical protein
VCCAILVAALPEYARKKNGFGLRRNDEATGKLQVCSDGSFPMAMTLSPAALHASHLAGLARP